MKKLYSSFNTVTAKLFLLLFGAVLLTIVGTGSAAAQQPLNRCGYKIDREALQRALDYEKSSTQGTQSYSYQVRVFFHIVAYNDGSDPAATPANISSEFNQMVGDYAGGSICFVYEGYDYVNNTQIDTNYNADAGPASTFDPYNFPNCLNVYYMAKIKGSNGACGGNCGYGGYTLGIPGLVSLVATGNIGYRHTTAHECGHAMGLLHTFEPANGLEDINGANGATSADLVADTHADPYAFQEQNNACFASKGCYYTGNCADPNGQTNYAPPYSNIMGYWGSNSCYSFSFTAGQFTRVHSYFSTNSTVQSFESATTAITEGPNLSVASQYLINSTISGLSTSGTVTITGNSIVELAGNGITLNPGFSATPTGNGLVWFQTTAPCAAGSGDAAIQSGLVMNDTATKAKTQNSLTVYPNPAAYSANVAITLANEQKNVAIQLYDMSGKRVKEIDLTNIGAGTQNVVLPVSNLATGVYYLMVRTDDGMLSSKMVIAR